MSFAKDGFLSRSISTLFTQSLRKVPEYRSWLAFAEELNRFALGLLDGREIQQDDRQRLMIVVLLVRAHKSFQAALILVERGLLGDARAVIRRAVEGAIALIALANEASFVDDFVGDYYFSQRKSANVLLNDPDYRSTCSPVKIAEMEQTVVEVNVKKAAGEKIKPINWEDVARKHHCKDLYGLLYRLLSSDGTHTNIHALHREVVYKVNTSEIASLKVGPDIDGMVETLKANCLMLLYALDPFTRAFDPSASERIKSLLERFQQLPQDEPVNTRIVTNFEL